MVLLTLLLAGLQPPTSPRSHHKPVHKKKVEIMAVVSPPPIVENPPARLSHPVKPAPPPIFAIRTPSPAQPIPVEPTAPLDLAIVKQPKLDKFYPKALRKAGLADSATINLTIDRKGKVAACRIRSAPTNPAFAEPACALGSKLRFADAATDYPGPLPIKIEWRADGVALVRAVQPRMASIVPGSIAMSEDDYPLAMRSAGIQGRVIATVVVPADGKVSDCAIAWANVPPEFDAVSCQLVMRGQFVPAQDEFGVAVPGRVIQPIRWKLND